MKLRSAPLDDVHQELRFVLEQDGRRLARMLLRLSSVLYRAHHALMIYVLRRQWTVSPPAIGREPSNPTPEEMEGEWEVR